MKWKCELSFFGNTNQGAFSNCLVGPVRCLEWKKMPVSKNWKLFIEINSIIWAVTAYKKLYTVRTYRFKKISGKSDSYVSSLPSAGTRGALGGHFHFIWDTQESLLFHFNCTCYSLVPLSFTLFALVGHLVSKVSNEWLITETSGLGGQFLQSTH